MFGIFQKKKKEKNYSDEGGSCWREDGIQLKLDIFYSYKIKVK